jgi:hypothetical protein
MHHSLIVRVDVQLHLGDHIYDSLTEMRNWNLPPPPIPSCLAPNRDEKKGEIMSLVALLPLSRRHQRTSARAGGGFYVFQPTAPLRIMISVPDQATPFHSSHGCQMAVMSVAFLGCTFSLHYGLRSPINHPNLPLACPLIWHLFFRQQNTKFISRSLSTISAHCLC